MYRYPNKSLTNKKCQFNPLYKILIFVPYLFRMDGEEKTDSDVIDGPGQGFYFSIIRNNYQVHCSSEY